MAWAFRVRTVRSPTGCSGHIDLETTCQNTIHRCATGTDDQVRILRVGGSVVMQVLLVVMQVLLMDTTGKPFPELM